MRAPDHRGDLESDGSRAERDGGASLHGDGAVRIGRPDAEREEGYSSLLQTDGTFTAKTFPYGEGMPPGTYKVTLRVTDNTGGTNVLAKDKSISDEWRGFKDVAASRHLANRVEPEVVEALVTAVRESYPRLSHRYYALKARWLGKEKLEYWDRNAPLPETPKATIGWEEARTTVLSAYQRFDPRMAEIARGFFVSYAFEGRWGSRW